MLDRIRHRGPDDSGQCTAGQTAIGVRRLSIIDLSRGHQPIYSDDGRRVIAFNGEIYNYRELRKELEDVGILFHTHSDTEVILRQYERYGPDCVDHLRGMFAFTIADLSSGEVFIARDRIGIKPLYYHHGSKAGPSAYL